MCVAADMGSLHGDNSEDDTAGMTTNNEKGAIYPWYWEEFITLLMVPGYLSHLLCFNFVITILF